MEELLAQNGLNIKQVFGYKVKEEELVKCESCGEEVPENCTEWFYKERICHVCLYENGYGE